MAARRKRQRLSVGVGESTAAASKDIEHDAADTGVQQAIENTQSATPFADAEQRRTLFVRSLPFTVTTGSLTEYFSQLYPLKHATVVMDAATKKSKGYGFVTFTDAEDAQRAKEELNGSVFEGRRIKIEIAEPRHREVTAGNDMDGHRKSLLTTASVEARAEREKKQLETRRPPKLIVRNLPWSIKKPEQLAALFRSYGKVKQAFIPTTKRGLLAGFGFVVMRGRKNSEKAIAGVNGMEVDGRQVAVDWAVEKDVWEGLQNEGELGEEVDPQIDDASANEIGKGSGNEQTELNDEERGSDMEGSEDISEDDSDAGDDTKSSLGDEGGIIDDDDDGKLPQRTQDNSSTIFIRNLPFSSTDDSLREHFCRFGAVRYARVVMDHATERPRGSGFVCFYNKEDTDSCVRRAPRSQLSRPLGGKGGEPAAGLTKHSVLQDEGNDPTGLYTVDGRVLQVTRAVDRNEASRLNEIGSELRSRRDTDKRRLYLLSEGTISSKSPLYDALAPSEIAMREASLKQRKSLLQSNPALHLSLTRLSVRNIPRSITSKDLKALAREAAVGFAKDVKANLREQLSKEEEARGGDEMKGAERLRKAKGKGIVKQAKIVFEGREGGKVSESSGAGRSRGYGFIEYSSHRWALMGLRWLNGRAVGQRTGGKSKVAGREDKPEKKRLVVEFAIENAQVVARRKENEAKARERSRLVAEKRVKGELPVTGKKALSKDTLMARTRKGTKRKRDSEKDGDVSAGSGPSKVTKTSREGNVPTTEQGMLAKRQEIIARKRMMRRSRAKGTSG
ncbi:MAG: RNA recognition motif-containing protein [Trichoglossum hirsutum]|nr:MAG: RNA recognition motif-containing protein [Trichoglossum hirsutum]